MRRALVTAATLASALLAGAALGQPLNLCRNAQGRWVRCNDLIAPVIPAGATARCKDGTFAFNRHISDACGRHGGVAQRYQ